MGNQKDRMERVKQDLTISCINTSDARPVVKLLEQLRFFFTEESSLQNIFTFVDQFSMT